MRAMPPQAAALLMLTIVPCAAQAPENLGFEVVGAGWTALGEGVSWRREGALVGKQSLSLESRDGAEAWAISAPISGFSSGEIAELNLAVKRVSEEGELAICLVSEVALPPAPALWRGAPGGDGRRHRLALRLVAGPAAPRIAIGAVGEGGAWLVDDIRVRPARVPPITRPIRRALIPEYAETLPTGWAPEGNLDLRTRTILGVERLSLRVGMAEVDPLREISVRRGERVDLGLVASGRGTAAKAISVGVSGPVGWQGERWEGTINGRENVRIRAGIQALRAGDTHVKIRFVCDTDIKETPLLVRSSRYYPALGVLWDSPRAGDLGATMPTQFHQVALSNLDADSLRFLATLADTGADVAITWQGSAKEAIAALTRLPEDLWPALGAFGLGAGEHDPAAQDELHAVLRMAKPEAVALSPPVELHATPEGLSGGEELADALACGLAARSNALTVRLPRLCGSAVLRESIDGRPAREAMLAWTHFDRCWDMGGLRALLRTKDALLPFFAAGVGGLSTGDAGLDALLLSRVIVHVFAMGANGVTIPATGQEGEIALLGPDGAPNETLEEVYGELTRELAGVRSLTPPPDTEIAGYAPGKPVTYRPFLRGDEGIIALWNNSGVAQEVAVDVRCLPTQARTLRISYPGEACSREYVGSFQWDNLARHYGIPAVFLKIEPLQVVVLSLTLRGVHSRWLREVGRKPRAPATVNPMDMMEFDKRIQGRR